MNKKFLMKSGIALIVIASLGFAIIKINKSNDIPEANVELEVEDNDLENTYIEDNYEMPEDEDLNEEFSNRVENVTNNEQDKEEIKNEEDNDNKSDKNDNINKVDNDNESDNSSVNISNKKTGSFQGFADDNFVEIKVGDEYATYRVSSSAKKTLSNMDINDSITFEFVNENGQLVITSVK